MQNEERLQQAIDEKRLQQLLANLNEHIFENVVITISAAREIGASLLEQNGPANLIDNLNAGCDEAIEAAKSGDFDEVANAKLSAAIQPALFWVLYPASRLQ